MRALSDEKLVLVEKLFSMQENFIRKLDQQIDKTAEDPDVRDKFNENEAEDPEYWGNKGKSKTKDKVWVNLRIENNKGKDKSYN